MVPEKEKMGGSQVVLYPSPGMGHLVSMVELAKLLLTYDLRVTILVLDPPFNTGSTASFLGRVSSSHPSISFHRLPPVSLSHGSYLHHESLHFELIRLSNPSLLSYLSSTLRPTPSAFVLDFFCFPALDVTKELNIPSYCFFTSAASCLAFFVHLPSIHDSTTSSFQDLGGSTSIHTPGILPIPANHVPLPLLDRYNDAYTRFLEFARRLPKPSGILINTFEWLEPRALHAIRNRRGMMMPPIYPIGPLIRSASDDSKDQCLAWLDAQPKSSVVFLCFGSIGRFSAEQLKEIGVGLEKSGKRFLWVVRSPPPGDDDDPSERFTTPPPEPDLKVLLPQGFVERTRGHGLVVKSWAPQGAVLRHEAVGGFVTHLGWNSVLEAIWEGVPMVGWPLYAEQRMNRVFTVEGMGVAMAMEGYDKRLVGAEEVERKVRELMEGEKGKVVRERVKEARARAIEALGEGGDSTGAIQEVVRLMGTY